MELSLENAKTILEHAFVEQQKQGFKPMAIVVLGSGGSIRASESQDGTSLIRPKIAHGKANAGIALGMGTRALMNRAEQQAYFIQSINGLAGGDMVPVPGGVLIRDNDGKLLGAVGISGDTSDNDEAAALAGIAAANLVAEPG